MLASRPPDNDIEKIKSLEMELEKHILSLDTLKKDISNCERTLSNLQEDISQLREQRLALTEKILNIYDRNIILEQRIESFNSFLKSDQSEAINLTKGYDKLCLVRNEYNIRINLLNKKYKNPNDYINYKNDLINEKKYVEDSMLNIQSNINILTKETQKIKLTIKATQNEKDISISEQKKYEKIEFSKRPLENQKEKELRLVKQTLLALKDAEIIGYLLIANRLNMLLEMQKDNSISTIPETKNSTAILHNKSQKTVTQILATLKLKNKAIDPLVIQLSQEKSACLKELMMAKKRISAATKKEPEKIVLGYHLLEELFPSQSALESTLKSKPAQISIIRLKGPLKR